MRLISCSNCGVVLDISRINKPQERDKAIWINKEYVPAINCPVCKTLIAYDDGEN